MNTRSYPPGRPRESRLRLSTAFAAAGLLVVSLVAIVTPASASTANRLVSDPTPSNVPYALPVTAPASTTSPSIDAAAPYTPAVMNLIAQLEPSSPPTQAQLANASAIVHDGANTSCHNVGPVSAPTGTTPSIMPLCWTDAQGVNVTSGPNVRNTTAPMDLMGLGATFDRTIGNAWGQTEGTESRELMVTGLFGPQTDLDRLPNWGRNLTTTGEDPYLSNQMVAAQINGIQGVGTMSEMKHFAVYNGQGQNANTTIQDQSLHQLYLMPYEGGFTTGMAAATMCSYQIWQDIGGPTGAVSALSTTSPVSPYAASGQNPQTWPLDESHFSCEQPLTLTYVLRDMWGSPALVGSDYPATHSTSGIMQGEDQEMPTQTGFFSASHTLTASQQVDATGSTCADAAGNSESCSTPGAVHVGGIPNNFQNSGGSGCTNAYGCPLVDSVTDGNLPLSAFNQSLARVLYEEQRFGMLGCEQTPVAASCTNPGGVGAERDGLAPLPTGPSSNASPAANLGTKSGDAAVSELESEEGGVLLKNDGNTLPITSSDLSGGVLVTGPGAEYTIADPTSEASIGYLDRDQINPLQQLQAFSGNPGAFTYVPANAPSGEPVPSSALSDSTASQTGHLDRTSGPGAPTTDSSIDFTTASGNGQLAAGSYTWSGYVYVPTTDTYTFRFQQSSSVPNANVTFTLDGTAETLANASAVYSTVAGTPTNAGYTEAGLTNRQFAAGTLNGGTYHSVTITFNNPGPGNASFRFAYSRANGDIADAAAAAAGKKLAVVFLNDSGATTQTPNPSGNPPSISAPASLSAANTALIQAVAAANPNTVVVLNTTNPVLMPWVGNVKSVLEMWFSGEEGGTSTARLLLGLADPSGHLPISFPANATDTIWGYNETTPLYPGDSLGQHPERLNGNGGCTGTGCPAATTTQETEGIYSGYRFFDKEGITPLLPFGWGLSYTKFAFSGLKLTQASDGGENATFTVTNTGSVAGTAVAQVYVGPPASQPSGIQFAVRQLAQFGRVPLAAGQSKTVTMEIAPRELSYWSPAGQKWVLDTGGRPVYVGDADATGSLPLSATVGGQQTGSVTCANQQLNASTINANLTVPAGAWCDLVDVTVTGNLTVQGGSGLRIANSQVNGNLVSENMSGAADPRSSGTNVVCGTTVKGNLTIEGSTSASPWNLGLCGANTVMKNVTFDGNAASSNSITGNTIKSNLVCDGNAAVTASGNIVTGQSEGQCHS